MTFPRLALTVVLTGLLGACRGERPAPSPTAEQKDRAELVRQPKEPSPPGTQARALSVLLLTDKERIRAGDAFRYRLEMRNAGREPLRFEETAPSFLKDGSLCGSGGFSLRVARPGGEERPVPCRPQTPPDARAPEGVSLTVMPGEFLLTRGSGPAAPFRELRGALAFDAPGRYRLKAVYDSGDGLRAESNAVALEVVP